MDRIMRVEKRRERSSSDFESSTLRRRMPGRKAKVEAVLRIFETTDPNFFAP